MKNKNNSVSKPVTVYYLWGDQEPCFHYACKLAQEAYAINGQRVYKISAGKEKLLESYKGEECIWICGLTAEDLTLWELNTLQERRCINNVDLPNLQTVIITAHVEPTDLAVLDESDFYELRNLINSLTCEYEVRKMDKTNLIRVSKISRGGQIQGCKDIVWTRVENVLIEVPIDNYFQKFLFEKYLEGKQADIDKFVEEARKLPVHEQRKLCAVLEIRGRYGFPVYEAFDLLEDLDCFDFYPEILNPKDLGYMCVFEQNFFDVPKDMMRYFNFALVGYDLLERERERMFGITEYGFIWRTFFNVERYEKRTAERRNSGASLQDNLSSKEDFTQGDIDWDNLPF